MCVGGNSSQLPGWCSAEDFKAMVKQYCRATYATGDKADMDPYYGQCIAPPLSISAGAIGAIIQLPLTPLPETFASTQPPQCALRGAGLVAALMALCPCTGVCDGAMLRLMVGVLALATACCGLAGFITSFWYFGYNTDHQARCVAVG